MFDFLKNKKDPDASQNTAMEDHFDSTQLAEPSRSEVVDAVLKDLLRRHVIPTGWIGCEVREIVIGQRARLHIQLVINRWSEQLMRYTAALQQQFIEALNEFEPHIDHSSYVVVWKFSESCNMPFPTIPENTKWYVSAGNADTPSSN